MGTPGRQRHSFRVPIAWKFFLLLAVIVPSVLAVSWVGARGMGSVKAQLDSVYKDDLATAVVVGRITTEMEKAKEVSLRLITAVDPGLIASLRSELRETVFPEVERRLVELPADTPEEHALHGDLQSAWRKFLAYTDSPEFLAASGGLAATDRAVTAELEALTAPLSTLTNRLNVEEQRQAQANHQDAERAYARSLLLLRAIVGLGVFVGVGVTLWLIRDVVVRVKEYSRFAAQVASGELNITARPRGHDELTDLGWALNKMVAQNETARGFEESQTEFTEAMQVTEGEEEAHGLLKRHLERSIPGSAVVVLNRNNSADRLEATTELPSGSTLTDKLGTAQPRDCMAVRLARLHHETPEAEQLISCGLCRDMAGLKTCKPLLVGGVVIGSVLLNHGDPLSDQQVTRIGESVTQAAPVLANLRNLAIAQARAATDQLSGLPNARAVQDTLKRLVAQASRMTRPLSAVLLDLDHFKEINDTFGHVRGDEVLAAVGVALQSTVRESDFVGRYGGEEFIMLLPNTGGEGAVEVAERVRASIADIRVLDGDRGITASFGVGVFPDDAADAARLIRAADRALYRAKANGRNRVEVVTLDGASDSEQTGTEPSEAADKALSLG
jgi:diguanylate cyclase (GGDEF)-like protein